MKTNYLATLGCTLALAGSAFAAHVTPSYDTFGPLSGANFGGSGNPTDPVAISTIVNSGNTITLGLAAQQRYSNPALLNDGNGTFFAAPGENDGLVSPGKGMAATWNFDYYIDYTGSSAYTFKLFYGDNPSALEEFNPLAASDNKTTPNHGGQNSMNLSFADFGGVPNTFSFDPDANADYSFVLEAYDAAGGFVGKSSIVVQVGTGSSVPDAGSTSMLLGTALAGFALLRRKLAA